MYCVYRDSKVMAALRPIWEMADEALQHTLATALERIDHELRSQPHRKGESRPGGRRILIDAPLAVVFAVDEDKRLVRVLRVWFFGARTRDRDRAA